MICTKIKEDPREGVTSHWCGWGRLQQGDSYLSLEEWIISGKGLFRSGPVVPRTHCQSAGSKPNHTGGKCNCRQSRDLTRFSLSFEQSDSLQICSLHSALPFDIPNTHPSQALRVNGRYTRCSGNWLRYWLLQFDRIKQENIWGETCNFRLGH